MKEKDLKDLEDEAIDIAKQIHACFDVKNWKFTYNGKKVFLEDVGKELDMNYPRENFFMLRQLLIDFPEKLKERGDEIDTLLVRWHKKIDKKIDFNYEIQQKIYEIHNKVMNINLKEVINDKFQKNES